VERERAKREIEFEREGVSHCTDSEDGADDDAVERLERALVGFREARAEFLRRVLLRPPETYCGELESSVRNRLECQRFAQRRTSG
jgi:hypothetical protein